MSMFDGLKKKLSSVIKAFSSKEEKELEREEKAEEKAEKAQAQTLPAAPEPRVGERKYEAPEHHESTAHVELTTQQHTSKEMKAPAEHIAHVEEPQHREEPRPQHGRHAIEHPKARESDIHLSAVTKIKGAILGKVKLSDSDIEGFLDTLRVSMLESDVAYNDTEEFLQRLEKSLRESKVSAKDIRSELVRSVRESLLGVISKTQGINLESFVAGRIREANLPVKILFIGPNGTGKTTTIAKVAHMLKQKGASIVISASDTFRAAAIEQTEYHANALHVPIIKSGYGADPASVAFDAVAYAKAHGMQIVLIDSAGRQETNRNLIGELQKMDRVIKPDINIYVGESTAGNAIITQVKEFMKSIRIDGIILTKLDCDAKGGGAISIANETGVPILFLGTGEAYTDLMPYDPQVILDAMLPSS